MQVYNSLTQFRKSNLKSVGVCIGNFDGMHLGHQALFDELKKHDLKNKLFLTFAPHPRKVLNKLGSDFQEITPLKQKAKLASFYGFNSFLALKFAKSLLQLTAREFVEKVLVEHLSVAVVVVGYDWRFGKGREGDLSLLTKLGKEFGFKVIGVTKFETFGERVSSSRVRAALADGKLDLVEKLLGRKFSIGAKVIKGDQRGKQLGFPTADMHPKGQLLPAHGVYCTIAKYNGIDYPAVSNLGVRPTFAGNVVVLETHLLDQKDLDLYNQCLEVTFLKRLRKEKKFASKDELIKQIEQDCILARKESI